RQHQQPFDGFNDIVDVGEVALHLPVVEDVDWAALQYSLGKAEVGHVGAPPRPVNGEKAQAGGGNGEQLGGGVRHQLVCAVGHGIERARIVDRVRFAKRHLAVAAIDGAGGGIDQVLHRMCSAGLQHRQKAIDVGMQVGGRVL